MAEFKSQDEKTKQAFSMIEQGVKDVYSSESFKQYLSCLSKFHSYSLNNTLLILSQKPEASLVAGYRAWQTNFNRHVNKGAIFVDIKGFPQDIYVPDGRNAGYIEYIHGGVARNVVEDIANLGLNSTFVSIVDNTALGEDVKQRLQNRNVNTDYMKSIENGMGTWLAVFDHNGELAGSISHRPNLMPIYSILEENGDTIIENSDSVVAEIDMDEEIVEKVVYLCQKHNKKLFGVVSNMNIAIERKDLLKQFDCLICNQLESSILFSRDFKEMSAEELSHTLIDELQQSEFNSLIVTLGEAGSLYVKNNGESGFCQARQIEVKDTTGAGDAFCAGTSAGLTYGKSMLEAMKIGSHLASSVIASCENVCPCFSQDKFDIVKK